MGLCSDSTFEAQNIYVHMVTDIKLLALQPALGGGGYIPSSPDSGECGLFSSVDVRSGPNKCSLIVSLITFCTILQEKSN